VNLEWELRSPSDSNEYRLQKAINGVWEDMFPTLPAGSREHSIPNLLPGKTYAFRVVRIGDTAASDPVVFTVPTDNGNYHAVLEQESVAVARKPRDAAAVISV